jgi:UDP-N-acetylmuramoyl-L-alanyl-D-glutamate--2,6-diaminopimelate ligase
MQICPGLGHLESLRKLLPDARFFGADDIFISGCTCDWRKVRPGDLFVVFSEDKQDAQNFLAEAIARGSAGVLSDRPLPELNIPSCLVSNAHEAFALICQALAGNPSEKLKVIGVTGANGKTTTSCLIAGVLSHAGQKTGLLGKLGYFDGDDVEDPTFSTPPPDRLATLLARMVRNGCSHAVVEVSRQALQQSCMSGVWFDAACITNVTRDHLDYHLEPKDYRLAKSRLFDHLRGEAFVVLNADDPVSAGYLGRLDGPVLTVGIHSPAEITATPLEEFPSEQTFLITAGSDTVPVRTQMIGTHHIYNCLLATAVGLVYGVELPQIVRSLEAAKHMPGRLERVECGQPFSVFIDTAHTPDALAGCLHTLRNVTQGRLICVFSAGKYNKKTEYPLAGRAVEEAADAVIITSNYPQNKKPMTVIRQVLGGLQHPDRAEVVPDRREAIEHALSLAQPGDCVLIAGQGYEIYKNSDENSLLQDDRQIASQWLYEVQPFAR